MGAGRSWWHSQAAVPSSSIPTAPGAHTQQCRAGEGDPSANPSSLFPASLVTFAKIQFRDVDGAIPVVEVIGTEGTSPCRYSHCHWRLEPATELEFQQISSSLSPGTLPGVLHELLIDPRLAAPPPQNIWLPPVQPCQYR